MKLKLNAFASVMAIAALSACGGGGGGDSASYNLAAMQESVLSTPRSFAASGRVGGDFYELFVSIAPAGEAVFEGSVRKQTNQSLTVRKNGVTLIATAYSGYYTDGLYQLAGARYSNGTYMVADGLHAPLPTAAKIGDSGSLGSQTVYSSARKNTVALRQQATWTLSDSGSGSAYYCVNTVQFNPTNAVIGSFTGCNKINAAGAILGIKWTLDVGGQRVTVQ
jgi:hypothetical protein